MMYYIQTRMLSYMSRVHARDSNAQEKTNYQAFVYRPQYMIVSTVYVELE
jgi:hypothetical protein